MLTKRELMENFDRIVTDRRLKKDLIADFLTRSKDPNGLLLGRYHVVHTSGSSGELAYQLADPWFPCVLPQRAEGD